MDLPIKPTPSEATEATEPITASSVAPSSVSNPAASSNSYNNYSSNYNNSGYNNGSYNNNYHNSAYNYNYNNTYKTGYNNYSNNNYNNNNSNYKNGGLHHGKFMEYKERLHIKYEDTEATFKQYEEVLNRNLEGLEKSFELSMSILDELMEANSEDSEAEEETDSKDDDESSKSDSKKEQESNDQVPIEEDERAKKSILKESFLTNLSKPEFQKLFKKSQKDAFFGTFKFLTYLNNPHYKNSIQVKIMELDIKEIPEASRRYDKAMVTYREENYKLDLDYKKKILVDSTVKKEHILGGYNFTDVVSYNEFKLSNEEIMETFPAEKENVNYLDLKLFKSEKYNKYLRDLKKKKLKEYLISEVLHAKKRRLDRENTKWLDRKKKLLKFINVDLTKVLDTIEKVNEEIKDSNENDNEAANITVSVEEDDIGGDITNNLENNDVLSKETDGDITMSNE